MTASATAVAHPPDDVAIVDDDEITLEYYLRLLRRTVLVCRTFTDAGQAAAALVERPPALLLIDHRMPSIDGIDLFERLGRTGGLGRRGNWLCSAVKPPEHVCLRAHAIGVEVLVKDRLNDRAATLAMLTGRLADGRAGTR